MCDRVTCVLFVVRVVRPVDSRSPCVFSCRGFRAAGRLCAAAALLRSTDNEGERSGKRKSILRPATATYGQGSHCACTCRTVLAYDSKDKRLRISLGVREYRPTTSLRRKYVDPERSALTTPRPGRPAEIIAIWRSKTQLLIVF